MLMDRHRFKYLGRAGLLSILLVGIFGLTQPTVRAQQSESTAAAADTSTMYTVQFVEQDDTLNVRSGPGVQYPIIDTIGNGAEVQATGDAVPVGQSLWLPIQVLYHPNKTQGWVNRRYLARHFDPTVFCADEAVKTLVETVREAVRTQDGDLLASTILPARGLYIAKKYWGGGVLLSEDEVRGMFTDPTIRDWGANMNSGKELVGSIPDIMLPLLERDLLAPDASIACNDNQDGLMAQGVYQAGAGLDALPFYSVMRPGAPGDDFDWGAWALGIDHWEGTPVLVYLSHYIWVP
jgi:hypothetical protein